MRDSYIVTRADGSVMSYGWPDPEAPAMVVYEIDSSGLFPQRMVMVVDKGRVIWKMAFDLVNAEVDDVERMMARAQEICRAMTTPGAERERMRMQLQDRGMQA